ncbi:hypothetical protein W97_08466 [Coniosporium apollinis CBS 100218]|uniref:Uncharacterized protein n=1 Tax=Coniosporium apollinis (strain CBS 100218) TaxID=1168221 RepID=R7Z4W2_CONA1|nr:uncharacterized protein W97_08466 [Coniosporium apollinis CBS 100218]EON69207.1 hypothetical protein W97_08466 [Coniosporium apollinis CBS 100218]
MAPIRIGFIGLSAAASGSGWANSAHLPYLRNTSKYSIIALCNSSVEAAQASVKANGLPAETKAYGSPENLAADADVDLVVCCVRVDKHRDALLPALEAGKDCFCEWPLGANLEQAQELARLADEKGVSSMVGLQARHSPYVRKVKGVVESGRIGKVLSTTVVACGYNFGTEPTPVGIKYLGERHVGGNVATIHFGHMMDFVLYALGELKSYSSIYGNQRPKVQLIDKGTGKIVETFTKDAPDQVLVQGHLESGALLSFHLRGGKPFAGEPSILWRVYGEKGEIQVTGSSAMLNIGAPDTTVKIHNFESGDVETLEVGKDDFSSLPQPAQNIARCYEAFADGEKENIVDFKAAALRHALIEEMDERERSGHQDSKATYRYL